MSGSPALLPQRLRVVVITDEKLASPRSVLEVVEACLDAGAPAVQLREKHREDAQVLRLARELRRACDARGALFFVDDRLDIALASGADGIHVGPEDVPPEAVRRVAPAGFLIGFSTDRPDVASRAAELGVDYIGCGAVFGTATKPEAGGERLGPEGLAAVVRASPVPVVAVGGITPRNAAEAFRAGAAGVAAVSAVMAAPDPGAAVRALLMASAARP